MKQENIYYVYQSLKSALEFIQSGSISSEQISGYYERHIQPLCKQLPKDENGQELGLSTLSLDELNNPEFIVPKIAALDDAIKLLGLEQPELVFLITAPFDEEEKTGDGQYARSLLVGFEKYSQTKCLWLKEESMFLKSSERDFANSYYRIPKQTNIRPIPENTIPSVYALQPVANKKTVITGYQVQSRDAYAFAFKKIKNEITPRTPKIITSYENQLLVVGFHRGNRVFRVTEKDVKKHLDDVSKKITSLTDGGAEELKLLQQAFVLLDELAMQFQKKPYEQAVLVTIIDKLSGMHKDNCYDYQTGQAVHRDTNSLSTDFAKHFKLAYEVAEIDSDRNSVILGMVHKIKEIGQGKKCAIDIHLRPPDTGAFIMPSDIETFKSFGLIVNITVHEYKQNYTRPHLQQLTHDLLAHADSVLFFNEKDRHNAIKASQNGYTDSKRPNTWPIQKYDLSSKASLTVASQILSGVQAYTPEWVLAKEPNILCFGTVRPNKGFEEALKLAKEINARVQKNMLSGVIPKVFIAGDPQCTQLMKKFLSERYGEAVFSDYLSNNPCAFDDNAADSRTLKIEYWNRALNFLESKCETLFNPYLEIETWILDLELLKSKCKYLVRLDDMGMRNNGSGIISVLNLGVIYTKWGCVTDKEYQPAREYQPATEYQPAKEYQPPGRYSDAVILSPEKYGKENKSFKLDNYEKSEAKRKGNRSFFNTYSGYNPKNQIESDYKRKEQSWNTAELLDSILAREQDQMDCAGDLKKSQNYQTVVAAQLLLMSKFTLEHSVLCLTTALLPRMPQAKILAHKEVVPNSFSLFKSKNKPYDTDVGSGSKIIKIL
jgi:hypothetical protein